MCLEMIRTKQYTECLICGKQGIEQAGDILPDKGILIQVIHEDGNICKFVEYSSISTFLDRSKKQNPRIVSCPICGQNGRIGNFRPSKDKNFHAWRYYIEHEQIDGYWGKKNKNRKHRRCYLTNDQKNALIKKLGRNTNVRI
jgi:hypothetical protein